MNNRGTEKFFETALAREMRRGSEVFWLNTGLDNCLSGEVPAEAVGAAEERLLRFAPYIRKAFPETAAGGLIESPLAAIPEMKAFLEEEAGRPLPGRLMLKCDNLLPVSGSIKARGGIYEVLCFAEKIALGSGLLKQNDDYAVLAGEEFRSLFAGYSVSVGSTGNLGLSIGIMSAKLGFRVSVHMSRDARRWKKDMLREKGAQVIEYAGDYEKAVAEGRRLAACDPRCHFVDDENSKTLFGGYAVAGRRLKSQLDALGITIGSGRPLFVYLPCGVGGGPGGVTYGLKQIFGGNVHCFFAEPVQAPCMLLGLASGKHSEIRAADIGLSGKTIADGLAVGRASGLVCRLCGGLIEGLFTVSDSRLEKLVRALYERENIYAEPSAAAGFPGFALVNQNTDYLKRFDRAAPENAVHIVWATGGGMVPEQERWAV